MQFLSAVLGRLTIILLLCFLHQSSFAQSPSQEDSDLAEQTAALSLEDDHDHNDEDNDSEAMLINPQAPKKYIFSLPLKTFLWGHLYGPRLLGSLIEAEKLFSTRLKNPNDTTPVMLKATLAPKKSKKIASSGNLTPQFHIGTDFKVPVGTPVTSVHKGTVYALGYMICPGNTLVIKHEVPGAPQPIYTAYKHLQRFAPGLKVGSQVEEGQLVALSGNSGAPLKIVKGKKTGCAGGANLHFEVRLPKSQEEQALLDSTSERTIVMKKKLLSLRNDLIATKTYVVNPADYVEAIDQICYARKRVEIQNAKLVESISPKRMVPISAGICGENSEKLLQMEFNALPAIYQQVLEKANLTL